MADLLQLMKYLGLTLSACGALAVLSLWWARRRIPDAQPLRWWETAAMFVYLLITLAILWASRLTHAPEFNAMLVTFALRCDRLPSVERARHDRYRIDAACCK
ncbi:MAG: hypothetical protein R3C56_08085 [Pirellulaceae bacterium]